MRDFLNKGGVVKKALYLATAMTLLFAVSGFAQLAAPAGPDNAPKIGDLAPDFQEIGRASCRERV